MNWKFWERNRRESGEREFDGMAGAKRDFGNAVRGRETTRAGWGGAWLDGLFRDTRYALRLLGRNAGMTATIVLTLAAVIGANTAVFSVVYGVILRPLPFEDAEDLVAIGGLTRTSIRAESFETLREIQRSYQDVSPFVATPSTLERIDGPSERLTVPRVAPSFFNTILRVRPEVGRLFSADDASADAPPVVVLGYDFWMSEFGGDPAVLGRTLRLRDALGNNSVSVAHEVVGVLPASFRNPSSLRAADPVYAPYHPAFVSLLGTGYVFGRLGPGVTVEDARTEWDVIADQVLGVGADVVVRAGPGPGSEPAIVGLVGAHGTRERPIIWLFFGAVVAVLLIGIGNLAGMEVARMPRFEQEMAVRAALGARRGQLMQLMLVRVLVGGLAGGLLGIAVAGWTHEFLVASLPSGFPRAVDIRVDRTVWVFSLALTLLSSMIIGAVPAWRSSGPAVQGVLKRAGLQHTGDRRHHRLRDTATAFQVAAGLSLAIGAGLLVESYITLTGFELGWEPYGMTSIAITPPEGASSPSGLRFEVADRLRMIDGIDAVTLSSHLPRIASTARRLTPAGGAPLDTIFGFAAVEGTYFQVLEIPLLDGRTFDASESRAGGPVAVLSEGAAREIWPGENPLGRRLTIDFDDTERVVVGVVGDVQENPFNVIGRQPAVYVPLGTGYYASPLVVARGRVLRETVEAIVAGMVPNARVELVEIGERMDMSMSGHRFQTGVLGGLATLAVVLAGIGVYSVLAHAVSRRTREFGVRIACGAVRSQLVALVVKRTLIPAAVGMAVGLTIAYSFRQVLVEYLFRTDPDESSIYLLAFAVVAATLIAAAAIPAYRAASLDPVVALRDE